MNNLENLGLVEAKAKFRRDGVVTIIFTPEDAKTFKKCCIRNDTVARLSRNKSIFGKLAFFTVMPLSIVLNTIQTVKNEKLNHAVDFHMISRDILRQINGEKQNDGNLLLTFYRKT